MREMAHIGLPIFLDLKLHDIPNTVAKAVQSLGPLAPAILTVHASGGRAMLEDAKAAAPIGTKVVAVTMLTSLDASDLSDTGVIGSPADHVRRLADLAAEAGVDGIVCSGEEVAAAKKAWPKGFSSSLGYARRMAYWVTRSASSRRAQRSTPVPRSWSSAVRSPRPMTLTRRPAPLQARSKPVFRTLPFGKRSCRPLPRSAD